MTDIRHETEYDVRRIDSDGECVDLEHHKTRAAAMRSAADCMARQLAAAVLVEKHRMTIEYDSLEGSEYTTITSLGDAEAIAKFHMGLR